MTPRPRVRHGFLLALPLALFAATPSLQWCAGPWVPLTQEQFAACLAAEFTGCTASVACELPSCDATSDSDTPTGPGNDRAFCVGIPAGGLGLKPVPEESAGSDAALLAGSLASLALPSPARGLRAPPPSARPPTDPRSPTAPIRGPPCS